MRKCRRRENKFYWSLPVRRLNDESKLPAGSLKDVTRSTRRTIPQNVGSKSQTKKEKNTTILYCYTTDNTALAVVCVKTAEIRPLELKQWKAKILDTNSVSQTNQTGKIQPKQISRELRERRQRRRRRRPSRAVELSPLAAHWTERQLGVQAASPHITQWQDAGLCQPVSRIKDPDREKKEKKLL